MVSEPTRVHGDIYGDVTVTILDRAALEEWQQRYADDYPDLHRVLRAIVRQSLILGQRWDVGGTDGFADVPKGVVHVDFNVEFDLDGLPAIDFVLDGD